MSLRYKKLNQIKEIPQKKTLIVLGAPRGGTSMVSGLLRILGIFMGHRIEGNHEDRDFIKWKRKNEKEKAIELVDERNQENDIWGVKVPGLILWMKDLEEHFRNPMYIIIYRNTFTSAISKVEKKNVELPLALSVTQNFYSLILEFVKESQNPMLFLSYENCCDNPIEFIETLSEFIGTSPSKEVFEKCMNFINPKKGYQKLENL